MLQGRGLCKCLVLHSLVLAPSPRPGGGPYHAGQGGGVNTAHGNIPLWYPPDPMFQNPSHPWPLHTWYNFAACKQPALLISRGLWGLAY